MIFNTIEMDGILETLNNSKLFAGCLMIMMNIGSVYVRNELSEKIDLILNRPFLRIFIVFCIAFVATRDVVTSLFLTVLFVLVFKFLLHDRSRLCVVPKEFFIDKISKKEYKQAKNTVDKYKKQMRLY